MPLGTLDVLAVEARGLPGRGLSLFGRRSSPFAQLSLDRVKKRRTRAARGGGAAPVWNDEPLVFEVPDGRKQLHVEAFASELFSAELLGFGSLYLGDVFEHGLQDVWVPLRRPSGKPAGEIRLKLRFIERDDRRISSGGLVGALVVPPRRESRAFALMPVQAHRLAQLAPARAFPTMCQCGAVYGSRECR